MPLLLERLGLSSTLAAVMTYVMEHPLTALVQLSLITVSTLFVFLILYTTRDILLRSRSLLAQISAVLLVSLFPIGGFLLYLLLRPTRTIFERALEASVRSLSLATAARDQKLATLTKMMQPGKEPSSLPRVFEVAVKKREKVRGEPRKTLRESSHLPA